MADIIIVAIVLIIMFFAVRESTKHFKGQGGCCGGGSEIKTKRKRLRGTEIRKMFFAVEGMHCKNCIRRIENRINLMDGVACRVNLKKQEAVISSDHEIAEESIINAINRLGYKATVINREGY